MLLLALLASAWFLGQKFKLPGKKSIENSEVVLEKIKSVCKLVTAEGYFSEIYDYKDYYHWDLAPFRKKALIRVKARVSIGYDLTNIDFSADQLTKQIYISGIPPLEIISTDHDIDYYDISEGAFNSFSADDYNKLNAKAKEYVEQVAMTSDLVEAANGKNNELLNIIKFMVEQAGWGFRMDSTNISVLKN